MEDGSRLCFERAGVHLLKLLISLIQSDLVDVIRDGKFFNALLKLGDFGFGRRDDVIDSVDVGGLSFASDEINIDVIWDGNVALGDRL